MQRKKQSKNTSATSSTPRASHITRTSGTHRWKRIAIWVGAAILVIGVIAIIWWRIVAQNSDKTQMVANVSAPGIAEFSNDNTMFFATPTSIPEPNNARDLSSPSGVTVSYNVESGNYAPAFKMNLMNTDLPDNIQIKPFIRGEWYLRGRNAIMFIPDSAWPAETKFTIKINPDLFNDDTDIDTTRVTFQTPEITATVNNFNLYPAPDDKKSVIGVAVISFNYAIDTTGFSDRVSVKLDDEKLNFSVQFDKFHRTAFIISDPVKITDSARTMRVKVNRVPAAAGNSRTKKISATATLESADNIFKISSIETTVADDMDGNAQQLILLNTTSAAQSNTNLAQYVSAYLLPTYRTDDERDNKRPHTWAPDEITDTVLSESEKLELNPMDFAAPNGVYQYAFEFSVSDKQTRYIYVTVQNGAQSANGFIMKNGATSVMRVPYPSESVEIAGSGALLSLAGSRELGIVARGGVNTAYVNLYKVKSSEINHLISQTYNVFASGMEFKSWSFGAYDMSVVFQKQISFSNPSMTRANYASIDLGDYLDRTYGDNTGIFIIQTGASENAAEYNDKRLILLTDLGIIRKINSDSSSDVFVSRLSDGKPASDVEISVLGRNGNAVWAGRTDADGHANIPALPWSEYRNAREPVAVVARNGNDVSFIPYNANNQRVEYSKFDIDGVYSYASTPLNAFIFSDRGIYRPGENLVLGGIVKNKSFKSLAGIPVRLQIIDSRGRTVSEQTFSLTADGMFDTQFEIPNDATLGGWNAYLYSLTSNNKLSDILGTTSFDVQEFVPDTLKITANIPGDDANGWIAPDNLSANVSLRNLFGTPATDKRISAHATLTPSEYSFDKFSGYKFTPNFIAGTGLSENTVTRAQTYSVELPDVRTDENGNATIDIKFDNQIPSGTYNLALNIRGFESNSGKNVQTNLTTRVSDAKYLVGWRASGDLSYVNRNAKRTINLVAIDHTANQITAHNLTMRLVKRENQTTLVKDYNNFYKYQTVSRDRIISQQNLNISENGTDITLDTQNGGTYIVQILDASDKILANVQYFVSGGTNATMQTDTNADLQIKLNDNEFAPGDKIEISITSPYTGAGLITIERDKVYAYKWFNTNSTSSVQHITVPAGFEGTGYVNVSFVRDINSRDIFTTPYAYAVAPFSADISARKIGIKLDVPDVVRDNKLEIKYTSDKNARMMIFAVDTGILQVAKYQIPNPLAHFFQKSALQVNTYQILSLLLPEYNILREYAKTGGGDYGGGMADELIARNPFGRKTQAPVAFYSKILNVRAGTTETISFDIPEYFNGSVRVFAVAANTNAVGAADTETLVQSPIIISTSAPMVVAPGDKFSINAVITNMTENSGANATLNVSATATGGISITDSATATATLPQNADHLFTFNAHANNTPGNADISLHATLTSDGANLSSRINHTTLSVRPATTFVTSVNSGLLDSTDMKISDFRIDMYPEYSSRTLYISRGASAMIMPLFKYLEKYEYPCTEQLVSRAMPYVFMPNDPILGTTTDKSSEKITETINTLRNRQNSDGSFALWSGGATARSNQHNANTAYLTAYVAQFLTMAHENGFNVPNEMLSRAIGYLRTFAGGTITDNAYASAMAYAIYVISENDYITTSYIDTLTQYANENIKNWQSELMGAYIASAYKIMKQDDLARDLISKYTPSKSSEFKYDTMFTNNVANDALYYYLANKYFAPENPTESNLLRGYIESGKYNAYTSATVIMALAGNTNAAQPANITITANASTTPVVRTSNTGIQATIPNDATEITITCGDCDTAPVFYTLIQQGYPTQTHEHYDGIDIIREYYDANGNRITSAQTGDIITVKIFARTRGGVDNAENIAITDLLPGGLTADSDSVSGDMTFAQVREDRVMIYADLTRDEQTFTYTATVGNAGTFAIPAIHAESMYNAQISATGDTGTFTVKNDASK